MERIPHLDEYKLDNPFHNEEIHEYIECVYPEKIYEWELKEEFRENPSLLKSKIDKFVQSLNKFGFVEIQGSRDKNGTYVMIYITLYELEYNESEILITDFISLNLIA